MRKSPKSPVYDHVIHTLIGELRGQGVSAIKANAEDFTTPGRIKWDEKDEGIIPDILVEHQGSTHVFEIEIDDDLQPSVVEDRWRLLAAYTRRLQGKFYLVIPEHREEAVGVLLEQLSVKPEILKLQGLA